VYRYHLAGLLYEHGGFSATKRKQWTSPESMLTFFDYLYAEFWLEQTRLTRLIISSQDLVKQAAIFF
jgi:hypothetical protein